MTGKLIITHGLPGSGKSTWAADQHARDVNHVTVVNRDDIRTRLFGEQYHTRQPDTHSEQQVSRVQQQLIHDGLISHKTVISDDTNLSPKAVSHLANQAQQCGAHVEQQYFDVSPAECKRRNEVRGQNGGRRVPDHVIDTMASRGYDDRGHLKQFVIGSGNTVQTQVRDSTTTKSGAGTCTRCGRPISNGKDMGETCRRKSG